MAVKSGRSAARAAKPRASPPAPARNQIRDFRPTVRKSPSPQNTKAAPTSMSSPQRAVFRDASPSNPVPTSSPAGPRTAKTSFSFRLAMPITEVSCAFTRSPQPAATATALPLPMAYEGSYSPDGSHLAYRPVPMPFGTWSHYRGGTSSAVWIANLADSSIERVPRARFC